MFSGVLRLRRPFPGASIWIGSPSRRPLVAHSLDPGGRCGLFSRPARPVRVHGKVREVMEGSLDEHQKNPQTRRQISCLILNPTGLAGH